MAYIPLINNLDISHNTALAIRSVTNRSLDNRFADMPTIYDFVQAGDSASDWGPVITRGLAASNTLLIPGSVDLPFSTITFPNSPAVLMGMGRGMARLRPIAGTTGAGHIIFPPSGDSRCTLKDVGLYFTQPEATTGFTQYIPAIYLNGSSRTRIEGVRLSKGWQGIVGNGNCGGLTVIDLESSCLYTNVVLDQCFDTVRFVNPHIWPFDMGAVLIGWWSKNSIGYQFGRVDDLIIDNGLTFLTNGMIFNTGVDGNGTFGNISNHDFDNFGGLNLINGFMTFSNCCFTLGDTTSHIFLANAPTAKLNITGCLFIIDAIPVFPTTRNSAIVIGAGAKCGISNCRFEVAVDALVILIDGVNTDCSIVGCNFQRVPTSTYVQPIVVYQTNARPLFSSNMHNNMNSATAPFLSITSNVSGVVNGNVFGNTILDASMALTNVLVSTNSGISSRTA